MHKMPWHSHVNLCNIWLVLNITKLVEFVLIDQMVSPELGCIIQLKGHLTMARYIVITVYVDQFSWLHFVCLQWTQMSAYTLESKNAFEAFCRQHGHMTICSWLMWQSRNRLLVSVGWEPTIKMALLRKPFAICKKRQECFYWIPKSDSQRPFIHHYGCLIKAVPSHD